MEDAFSMRRPAARRAGTILFAQSQAAPAPLDFPARGQDKWQVVRSWLIDAQRLAADWRESGQETRWMTIADDILDLMKRKRKLTLSATDIADILYWEDKTYRQRVVANCLMLYEKGRLARGGTGSPADPFTYSMRRDALALDE
jgi:hypothetical protein